MKAKVFWFFQTAIIFRLTYSNVIKASKSLHRIEAEGFGYVFFTFYPNSTLKVASENKRQFHAQNYKQCLVACANNKTCLSINFSKKPIFLDQGKGQYLCELLTTDRYDSSSFYARENLDFNHYSIRTNCSKSPCLYNFTCIPKYAEDTYECLCPRPPYEGKDCRDVDECTTGQHACSPHATCTNIIGSHECKCKAGFHGDGTTCEKVSSTLGSDILKDYGNASYHLALVSFMDEVQEDIVNASWIRCWSGKHDGCNAAVFHPQCDGKGSGPTITLVRKGPYIFGGYTDIPWSTVEKYYTSTKSFLFSLYNMNNFNPVKLRILPDRTIYAVRHEQGNGPVFGGGHDLVIYGICGIALAWNSYEKPSICSGHGVCYLYTGSSFTKFDDIEVFYKHE